MSELGESVSAYASTKRGYKIFVQNSENIIFNVMIKVLVIFPTLNCSFKRQQKDG